MNENRSETTTGRASPGPDLATEPADSMAVPADAVVRRTRLGWRVGEADVPDLTCAMVLADLLAADLAADQPAGSQPPDSQSSSAATPAPSASSATPAPLAPSSSPAPSSSSATSGILASSATSTSSGTSAPSASATPATPAASGAPASSGAPATPDHEADSSGHEAAVAREARRLRATVSQLEHALIARIRVEQAIGVLAERHRIQPRQAFEQLRTAARNRGRRVIDIAADVVASATNPLLQLPDELSRPRSSGRNKASQPRNALESE